MLPRPGFSVRSEVQLSQQPLRIDCVVVRREELPPPPADSPLRTARLFYEAAITLGEIKGPKDVLRPYLTGERSIRHRLKPGVLIVLDIRSEWVTEREAMSLFSVLMNTFSLARDEKCAA